LQEDWDEGLMTGHLSDALGSDRSKSERPHPPTISKRPENKKRSPAAEQARYLAPHDHASHTRILRCTPQSAYTRLDAFLDRFAAFFSFGVRVTFFLSSLLFLISLGMVFAPNICVWGTVRCLMKYLRAAGHRLSDSARTSFIKAYQLFTCQPVAG
jgi:hypothetical protein